MGTRRLKLVEVDILVELETLRTEGLHIKDPEAAHAKVDDLLLAAVHPAIAEEVRSIIHESTWWAAG